MIHLFVPKIFIFSLFYLTFSAFSQSRIVLNNDPWVVMNNNAFIVIDNNNANAITLAGTGGRIISESENNRIRWIIGTATGAYAIPFADNVGEGGTKIPLTFTIGTAGVGAGYIDFSTFDGATWDNSLYMPSMVTHMGQYLSPNAPNNSQKAIDRFWLMNPISYATKPTPSQIIFTYIDNEHTPLGNSITETALGAQRFNNGTSQWGDMLPIGLVNTVTNTVTTPTVTPSNYFAAWTLSDSNDPLPLTLLNFDVTCINNSNRINWSTASEFNTKHFSLYKSEHNSEFKLIDEIPASGFSNTIKNYSFIDIEKNYETIYYLLTQTDFDGITKELGIISAQCNSEDFFEIIGVFSDRDNFKGIIQLPENGNYTLTITDIVGKIIYHDSKLLNKGKNIVDLGNINSATGIYFISVNNNTIIKSSKFLISK